MINKIIKLQSLGNITYFEGESVDGLLLKVGIPFHTENEEEAIQYVEQNYKTTREQVESDCGPTEEYLANEYKYLRAPEYPPLTDLADAMYWSSQGDNTKLEAYYAACEAVKNKYPKV